MRFPKSRSSSWLVFVLAVALARPAFPAQQLFTTQFIVVGEGLAAGMADFQLRDVYQNASFPAVMANAFQTAFPMPILQSPGIGGGTPGFQVLPPRLPGQLQGAVRNDFPPGLFVFNLSVPGFTLSDSLNRAPKPPLIQSREPEQTLINFILGYPALIAGANLPLWTQVQYAVEMNPTLVVVELGYFDVLQPAATNDPAALPDVSTFSSQFSTLLSRLNASSPQIIVMTVPNPFDTAYFTPVSRASRLLGAPASVLTSLFGVGPDDYLTPNGLMVAGSAIAKDNAKPNPLSATQYSVVSAATATAVEASVAALNSAIVSAAQQVGPNVIVYDLHGFFSSVRQNGLAVGTNTLTADYLGGFYSLDGYYPGQTGHAAIANNLLRLLNSTYGTSFPTVNLATVAAGDPVLGFTPAAKKPAAVKSKEGTR
ncbi:MAG: hypothetical protein ABSH31_22845 [Bryobacteraceae bacterium]|jgi:hypothetical protein